MTASPNPALRQVISADQIQKRVRELGRQVSDDYRGQTVLVLGILENSFMFMSDLVRAMDVPVVCAFIKPRYKQSKQGEAALLEIFFTHELAIPGKHILLVEGLVHSGVTTEFLMSDLRTMARADRSGVPVARPRSNWPPCSTASPPAASPCSPTISAFSWTKPSSAATASAVPNKPDATCRTWPRQRRNNRDFCHPRCLPRFSPKRSRMSMQLFSIELVPPASNWGRTAASSSVRRVRRCI